MGKTIFQRHLITSYTIFNHFYNLHYFRTILGADDRDLRPARSKSMMHLEYFREMSITYLPFAIELRIKKKLQIKFTNRSFKKIAEIWTLQPFFKAEKKAYHYFFDFLQFVDYSIKIL